MKAINTISAVAIACSLTFNPAHAARNETQQALLEGGTFASATIAGTAIAGPVGFVVGALSGAFLADQTRNANNAELALEQSQTESQTMQNTIVNQQQTIAELEQKTLQKMTFQVLFATGEDQLNEMDLKRIAQLAHYLKQNPQLTVELSGHADPRGTDEYNNVLSQERALAVKQALLDEGIAAERIAARGWGTQFSQADKGDITAYSQDRRVDIELSPLQSATQPIAKH